MRIHHNKTFDCYEDCEQDINAFGKEIFLDGHKLYTKADLVTMLTELQLEIEEVKTQSGFDEAWDGAVKQCSEIIQQNINSLKEAKDGENNN